MKTVSKRAEAIKKSILAHSENISKRNVISGTVKQQPVGTTKSETVLPVNQSTEDSEVNWDLINNLEHNKEIDSNL
jgi:hypothetical protein